MGGGGFGGGPGAGVAAAAAAGGRPGRTFTNDLYADYNGPEGGAVPTTAVPGSIVPGAMPLAANLEPSKQIMVRNVSLRCPLCVCVSLHVTAYETHVPWTSCRLFRPR